MAKKREGKIYDVLLRPPPAKLDLANAVHDVVLLFCCFVFLCVVGSRCFHLSLFGLVMAILRKGLAMMLGKSLGRGSCFSCSLFRATELGEWTLCIV